MRPGKLRSLRDAIDDGVPDGSTVLLGAALEALVPFAAGYEIIRRRRRGLTLVAPISDMLFDVLIGAGVARKVVASWVGNVSAGSGYNFRRAVEDGVPHPLEVVDHSNLTLATALHAAALGVPYLPTRTALGSDVLRDNPQLKVTACPFTGVPLVAVAALPLDVCILGVQRADVDGNAHVLGNLGVTFDAARAAGHVILLAEEIVPRDEILAEPTHTVVPGFLVSAVVLLPEACHPSPSYGCHPRDHGFFHAYHDASKARAGFEDWLQHFVLGVEDHAGYLERVRRSEKSNAPPE